MAYQVTGDKYHEWIGAGMLLLFPNYWGTMPMHVWTFLEKYDFTGKMIKPLCTHEGSKTMNYFIYDIPTKVYFGVTEMRRIFSCRKYQLKNVIQYLII